MTDGERDEFETVVAAVRERVDPDAAERRALDHAAERVRERTREAVAELPVEADVLRVGSTARGTWLSGDRDIDVFVRFPSDLPREDLEAYGLRVGHAVLPDGREAYAEHPYVTGSLDGFAVDLVPCYGVESATEIRSAVDRTPFHTEYLAERLDEESAAAVRLFKGFLVGAGVYGSDLRTRGFSGYLAELLVLAYGGFHETLAAAADWHPPVRLDPEDHGTREFDDPLVVVDPTDPGRNVAAVVSAESVARLQHHARAFLRAPAVDAFDPDPPAPLSPDEVRAHLERRGTHPVAVRFEVPGLVDDQLYPQLRRSLAGLERGLAEREFDVLRSAAFATPLRDDAAGVAAVGDAGAAPDAGEGPNAGEPPDAGDDRTVPPRTAVLFLELSVAERPAIERHEGPPVHVREHAEGFYRKYADAGAVADADSGAGADDAAAAAAADLVYGPFVDGDRYVVEREREVRTAREFLDDHLLSVALGADVEDALREEYGVLSGEAVASLADEFGAALARYFSPSP